MVSLLFLLLILLIFTAVSMIGIIFTRAVGKTLTPQVPFDIPKWYDIFGWYSMITCGFLIGLLCVSYDKLTIKEIVAGFAIEFNSKTTSNTEIYIEEYFK